MLDWASIIIDGVPTPEVAESNSSSAPCEPRDQVEESLLDRLGIRVEYVETPGAAAEAVVLLAASSGVLGLDIETAPLPEFRSDKAAGLDPQRSSIRLIQVYGGGSTVYVFDVHALKGLGQLAPLWPMQFVAHNATFELKHLLHAGADGRRIDCTMLQANLLRGELCGLAVLAEDVLGWEISKELQKSDWTVPELAAEQIEYAALDAVTVYRLFQEQKRELAGNGREESYQLLRDAQPAIARMELGGIWLDRGAHSQLVARWQAEFKKAEGSLREVLGPGVNPSSPPQLSAWLEAKLNDETLARWPRTKTGQLGTSAEALNRFGDLPIVKPLLAYKDLSKKLSTYGDKFAEHISPVTGRIHASFRLGGTKTGRLACSKPNIQNPPREEDFRALFAAPPGRRLVVAD